MKQAYHLITVMI